MHLGISLRKAQNTGVRKFYKEQENETDTEERAVREYELGDRFVHEFCGSVAHQSMSWGPGVCALMLASS